MKNDMIHLLVSFDQNYIKPFQTMIKSLSVSNPNEVFHICLMHSSISQEQLQELGMRHARFQVAFAERKPNDFTADGVDEVSFAMSANLGQPLTSRGKRGAALACWNIALRLEGHRVPIMRIR